MILRPVLASALLAGAASAQDRTPQDDPPAADPPPARVAIELGDVELKVRSLRILITIDPERAEALASQISGARVVATQPAE